MSLLTVDSDAPSRVIPDAGKPVTVKNVGTTAVFFGPEQGISAAVKAGELVANATTEVTVPTYFLAEPPTRIGTNPLRSTASTLEVTQTGTQLDRLPPESVSGVDVPGSFLGRRLIYSGQLAIKDAVAEVVAGAELLPVPSGGEPKALVAKKIKLKPTEPIDFFRYESSDYAIPGRTPQLQVEVDSVTNATNPNVTFTVGVLPLDKIEAGAVKELEYAFLTLVAEAKAVATGAKQVKTAVGTPVALPASNLFVVGVTSNGATAAESNTILSVRVYVVYA